VSTFVLVHAHPDDETLWTGALIATLAAQGKRVIVVTCTRGERGEVITKPGTATEGKGWLFGNHEALAEHRTSELRAALAALGNGHHIEHYFLDELPSHDGTRYVDSGMSWLVEPSIEGDDPRTSTGGIAEPDPGASGGFATAPLEEEAQRLAGLLNSIDDDLKVVTYEADGGYGHPDHVRAHHVAVEALKLASGNQNPAATKELWEVTRPDTDHNVDIPLTPVLPQVLAAMRAYASQVQDVTEDVNEPEQRVGWFALSNGVPLPIRAAETYRTTKFE
jgi:LmbE family N-acetylglucosaminyl deacetylase